ncbi:NmrA family protein (plasmid) [Rhizobium favelukesii]|uniref:NmrA family protein n=1 Tax=Rhizobium favelukesii TaxID=348824 RepID=W6S3X0_9HYPH|nr:NmrA family protein [Rhizobium favelukesii]
MSPGAFQPIAADDVANFVAEAASARPLSGSFDIAGPQQKPMSDFLSHYLAAAGDARKVVADPTAKYFGAAVDDESLVPLGPAKLDQLDFDTWFAKRGCRLPNWPPPGTPRGNLVRQGPGGFRGYHSKGDGIEGGPALDLHSTHRAAGTPRPLLFRQV